MGKNAKGLRRMRRKCEKTAKTTILILGERDGDRDSGGALSYISTPLSVPLNYIIIMFPSFLTKTRINY